MVGCDLRIAVYWTKWNCWTLIAPTRFEHRSGKSVLQYKASMMFNEMATLGDLMIGCKFPLTLEIETRKDKPRTVKDTGEVVFQTAAMNVFCANQPVKGEVERNIAWYLVNYGDWDEQPTEAIVNKRPTENAWSSPPRAGCCPPEEVPHRFGQSESTIWFWVEEAR